MPKFLEGVQVSEITSTMRLSKKVGNDFATFEYSETWNLPPGILPDSDMVQDLREALQATVNNEIAAKEQMLKKKKE